MHAYTHTHILVSRRLRTASYQRQASEQTLCRDDCYCHSYLRNGCYHVEEIRKVSRCNNNAFVALKWPSRPSINRENYIVQLLCAHSCMRYHSLRILLPAKLSFAIKEPLIQNPAYGIFLKLKHAILLFLLDLSTLEWSWLCTVDVHVYSALSTHDPFTTLDPFTSIYIQFYG